MFNGFHIFSDDSVNKMVVLVPEDKIDTIYKKFSEKFSAITHMIISEYFIEFLTPGVNKAFALQSVMKELSICA